ncbi:MAG: hypothetical protein JSS22_18650 [Proteobacteria bacterium]|nr:hypothetical protein [Pseudomonadota bacterium]
MAAQIVPFSDEETRVLVNLAQQYEVWMEAERVLAGLPYNLRWKTVSGRDYLYEIIDRQGNGKSLGPRTPQNEAAFSTYHSAKDEAANRRDESRAVLDETCRLYRALRLPLIPAEASQILREADRRSLLGSHLLVIGTNAVPAYFIEAGGRITNTPAETHDFDLAWSADHADAEDNPVWALLKSVDSTYTVNTERTFQARNAKAYEVELLVAPSRAKTMGRNTRPMPVPLEEQEWLLKGRFISHVVVGRDASPARLVVPDPRWFALQKLWLSAQGKRSSLKRGKDERQGVALLNAIQDAMPQFRMDAAFEAELPAELRPHFERWKTGRKNRKPKALGW